MCWLSFYDSVISHSPSFLISKVSIARGKEGSRSKCPKKGNETKRLDILGDFISAFTEGLCYSKSGGIQISATVQKNVRNEIAWSYFLFVFQNIEFPQATQNLRSLANLQENQHFFSILNWFCSNYTKYIEGITDLFDSIQFDPKQSNSSSAKLYDNLVHAVCCTLIHISNTHILQGNRRFSINQHYYITPHQVLIFDR